MKAQQLLRNIPQNFCYTSDISPQYYPPQYQYPQYTAFPPQSYPSPYPPISQSHHVKEYQIDTSKIVKLKDCNPKDIVYITKNRVVEENVIKVPVSSNSKSKLKEQGFKRPEIKIQKQSEEEQARQNEELFNYQKLMKEKKDRKQKFLQDIQKKISQAEKEASELETQFREEQIQLRNINTLQEKLNDKFKNQLVTEEISRIQRDIQNKQVQEKNKKIEINMQINEIRRVIQNQQELDQRVIDEADEVINRARGIKPPKQTHIQRTKEKPSRPQKKLAATVTSFNMTRKQK